MQKFLGILALITVCCYLLACAALFFYQRALLYFPTAAATVRSPLVATLDAPGARLCIAERPRAGAQAVIYFGGNAEDVSASLPLLAEAFPDHALYLPHYRGYAGSTGKPTERDLVADALLLFDQVAAAHPDVVLIGRSLGSGVAVQVASRRKVSRLVLVTPYDSIVGLAAAQYPFFPVRWLLQDKYESWRYAPAVRAPTLLIAAGSDEIIPAASTARLLAHFGAGIASLQVIDGATHNGISAAPAYLPLLRSGESRVAH